MEAAYWESAISMGFTISRPPRQQGKERTSRSRAEQAPWPVQP